MKRRSLCFDDDVKHVIDRRLTRQFHVFVKEYAYYIYKETASLTSLTSVYIEKCFMLTARCSRPKWESKCTVFIG